MLERHTSCLPPVLPCAWKEVRHASGAVPPLERLLEERALSRHPPPLSAPPPPPSAPPTNQPLCFLPSTQAGLARVVPAIWPFLQAQRAVCLAMVRRGWLLSLSSVTISHVPAASWPGNDIAAHNKARLKCGLGKRTAIKQHVEINLAAPFCSNFSLHAPPL